MKTDTGQAATLDRTLIAVTLALSALGLTMVTSASMVTAMHRFHQPWHFAVHQAVYLVIGILAAVAALRIRILFWENNGKLILLLSLACLLLVLIPHVGIRVNGSARWVGFGPLRLQVSELAKFAMVIYTAGYLVRHGEEVRSKFTGFFKPLLVLGVTGMLLLLEPDFGSTVVISLTVLSLLFLADAPLLPFLLLLVMMAALFTLLAVTSPYRLLRLTTFLHPWASQFHGGYQLVQSLIAFGRGGLFGVGLGDSVQKLFYLPEAHTDFLFAVLAEELGLVGVLAVITLYAALVWRGLRIGRRAQQAGFPAAGYMAYGIAVWIGIQAFINMGVNCGMLPTKGLTLPLMSYGGSSLVITYLALGILLRIDYETRASGLLGD